MCWSSVSCAIRRKPVVAHESISVWEGFGTLAMIYVRGFVIDLFPTRYMNHFRHDDFMKSWMRFLIRKFCTTSSVYVSWCCCNFVFVDPDEQMKVRESTLLKFDNMDACSNSAQFFWRFLKWTNPSINAFFFCWNSCCNIRFIQSWVVGRDAVCDFWPIRNAGELKKNRSVFRISLRLPLRHNILSSLS